MILTHLVICMFWDLGIKIIPGTGTDSIIQIPGASLATLHNDAKGLFFPTHMAQSRRAVLKKCAVRIFKPEQSVFCDCP